MAATPSRVGFFEVIPRNTHYFLVLASLPCMVHRLHARCPCPVPMPVHAPATPASTPKAPVTRAQGTGTRQLNKESITTCAAQGNKEAIMDQSLLSGRTWPVEPTLFAAINAFCPVGPSWHLSAGHEIFMRDAALRNAPKHAVHNPASQGPTAARLPTAVSVPGPSRHSQSRRLAGPATPTP